MKKLLCILALVINSYSFSMQDPHKTDAPSSSSDEELSAFTNRTPEELKTECLNLLQSIIHGLQQPENWEPSDRWYNHNLQYERRIILTNPSRCQHHLSNSH